MGQGQSVQHTRDTIVCEQYRAYCDASQRAVRKAFEKCIEPISRSSTHTLPVEEKTCVEEYALQYAHFSRSGFAQFNQLYELHQREMYEKARQEAMKQQARHDAKQLRTH